MVSTTSAPRRIALAGGLAAAVVGAPLVVGLQAAVSGPAMPLASCPQNEVLDPMSGACKPVTDKTPTTLNPIEPGGQQLQPGSITSSRAGDVGSLPEVNGIPCNGDNSDLCIGLNEQNNSLPKVSP